MEQSHWAHRRPSHTKWRAAWLAIAFAVSVFTVLTSWPDEAQSAEPAPVGSTTAKPPPLGFEPVSGAPRDEQVDASVLVVLAYASFFVLMFGYIIVVARKQAEIAAEMTHLAERIASLEKEH